MEDEVGLDVDAAADEVDADRRLDGAIVLEVELGGDAGGEADDEADADRPLLDAAAVGLACRGVREDGGAGVG